MTEETKDFPELDYEPCGIAKLTEDKTISFEVNPTPENRRYGYCETKSNTAKLYWDGNRKLWLAEVKGEFLESEWDQDAGGMLYLPYTDGPFILNLSASKKILEAFSIPENRVDIKDITRLSPSKLEQLAQSKQELRSSVSNSPSLSRMDQLSEADRRAMHHHGQLTPENSDDPIF